MGAQGLTRPGQNVEIDLISGGSQNELFAVRQGDVNLVLRKPPQNALPHRDEGILREWRIISALEGTDVPHTPAVAVCEDPSVLGRPFYLMGFVDGWSAAGGAGFPPPFDSDPEARFGLAEEVVDGVVAMAGVDWRGRGLQNLGRPEGFHDRQVPRWTAFFENCRGRDLPGYDVATAWLTSHRPLDYIPGLMHGDYQFANVMFRPGLPPKLTAIIDWEMGTIGDHKLDLAWFLQGWSDDSATAFASFGSTGFGGTTAARGDLVARFAERSGRQIDDFDYYLVLARWKFAIVLEQGFQRASGDQTLEMFGPYVLDLMQRAAELAETSDYRSS
jgi:aminoglycoside phosphotransferase (APT) family kinase protein